MFKPFNLVLSKYFSSPSLPYLLKLVPHCIVVRETFFVKPIIKHLYNLDISMTISKGHM